MVYRTTNRAIRNGFSKVIQIPYCYAQELLSCVERTAYTAGVYGWNADLYDFGNVAICTGYRPVGNVNPDIEVVKAYERKANDLRKKYAYDWQEFKSECRNLIYEFIDEVTM